MQIGKIMHRDVNIIAPPVDNFYEWKKVAGGKQPYEISLADRGLRALAGLWENWRSSTSEWVRSFAIVMTTRSLLPLSPGRTSGCRHIR